MSVVAGCSLYAGVVLVSDCRATIERLGGEPIYVDNVQKLFPLTRTAALGFVGDISVAAAVLRPLPRRLKMRSASGKLTAIGLLRWLPRYFRYSYAKLAVPRSRCLVVMVAAVVPGRPNVIERAKVVALMERFRLGKLSHERNWLPGILVKILSTPANVPYVRLLDAPTCLLYVMESPDFAPSLFQPLDFIAIGSGEHVVTQLDAEADWIFAGDIGNPSSEAAAVRECVTHFIHKHDIPTVGGLFPCIRVDASGVRFHGHRAEIPVGGDIIELRPSQAGRWSQIHANSNTEVRLLYPWEIDFSQYRESATFDHLKRAIDGFRGGSTKTSDA